MSQESIVHRCAWPMMRFIVLLIVIAGLTLVACAAPASSPQAEEPTKAAPEEQPTAAPEAEPTKAPEVEPTTPPAAAPGEPVPVRVALRDTLPDDLVARWQADLKAQGIALELEIWPSGEFLSKLAVTAASGAGPDLVALWNWDLVNLGPNATEILIPYPFGQDPGIDLNGFLKGGLNSASLPGNLYGLPWRRYYCLTDYMSLALTKWSNHPSEAVRVMDYLTQESPQKDTLEQLAWYPTRSSLYDDRLGCSNISLEFAYVPLTGEQYQVLQASDMKARVFEKLDPALRGKGYLSNDIAFNTDGATGLVVLDEQSALDQRVSFRPNTARNVQAASGVVRVAAVPVTYNPNIHSPNVFTDTLAAGTVVGALLVNDPGVFGGNIPSGDYGVWAEGDEVKLIDENGNSPDIAGYVERLYGEPPPPEGFEWSFATVETGSFRICFKIDGRGCCIP